MIDENLFSACSVLRIFSDPIYIVQKPAKVVKVFTALNKFSAAVKVSN